VLAEEPFHELPPRDEPEVPRLDFCEASEPIPPETGERRCYRAPPFSGSLP
jgi:hypothetical protein